MHETFRAIVYLHRLLVIASIYSPDSDLYDIIRRVQPACEEAGITLSMPTVKGRCRCLHFYKIYFNNSFAIACLLEKRQIMPVICVSVDGPCFAARMVDYVSQVPVSRVTLYVEKPIKVCPVCGERINLRKYECGRCRIDFHDFPLMWELKKRGSGFVISTSKKILVEKAR